MSLMAPIRAPMHARKTIPLAPIHSFTKQIASIFIKTHGSELRGQEEAGRMQTSELFTGSTTVNFVNTLNKPPLKLSLS